MTKGEKASRLLALDGLRGVAAVVVLFGHARLVYIENIPNSLIHAPGFRHASMMIGTFGATAVWLFFILSGFVLARMWLNAPEMDYGRYVLRRLVRLYVPVWGSVVLTVLTMLIIPRDGTGLGVWVQSHAEKLETWRVVADLTLLAGTGSNNTPLWSLRWEVLFSLLLIVYIAACRMVPPWIAAAGCLLLSAIGGASGSQLLLYMPMFGIGVAFAFAWGQIESWRDRWHTTTSRLRGGAPVAAVATVMLAVGLQFVPVLLGNLGLGAVPFVTPFITTACRLASVAAIIVIVGTSVTVGRAFSARPVLWLGLVSFSLYLTHEIVLLAFVYPTGANTIALLIAVAVCFPVAWIFYRLVEAPAHTWSRRVGLPIAESALEHPDEDPLSVGAQPTCPHCAVAMRPAADADECPSCGHREPWAPASRPSDPPGIIDL